MARALTADPAASHVSPAPAGIVRLPLDGLAGLDGPDGPALLTPLAAVLEPAIVACEAAIAFRVREGTRVATAPRAGLLTALVDAVEVGQTCLDLARRGSPLVPAGRDLCRLAFARAEAACRERGDAPLVSCADALADAARGLRGPPPSSAGLEP